MVAVGLVVTTGCTATATPAPTTPDGAAAVATDDAAAAAVFDRLVSFWATAYPAAFGTSWIPLRGGMHPLDSQAAGEGSLCISTPDGITGNAFYCTAEDGIVYDTGVLVPVLLDHYGEAGLTASLAHEFGHAVAARTGTPDSPLLRELQADCFAGTAVAALVPVDQQIAALAPLLDFADPATTAPDSATAHGLAVDRGQAALLGSRHGPAICRTLGPDDIEVTLGRLTSSDRTPRTLPTVTVTDADRALAAPLGDAALAAVDRLEAATGDDTVRGCAVGRWMRSVFGAVGPDQVGGRPTDPDEALNLLRARPGATLDLVAGYLDGLAGRC